ncbi:DegT/DnrJ/EryC1/StrS family aminotransferase [Salinilacihabitans rarus]|uniref:DegT/DnrJ/EryC1/StrS family aminotransferase n=1 Tax=Salinilacihabitans rarus TaxID=2961596 RepID=UPI0020C8A877|nr:DegT/DnrJ/EryC1/StrS family aminotransferase [Salinilacihabitans rarus]
MIGESPSLVAWSLSEPRPADLRSFLDVHADAYECYGSGKVALRDGLAPLSEPGENVLLPAYLPDAVAEPLAELGLEARYYAIEPDLSPDLADLESRVDEGTVAVLTVDYFGFPTPDFEAVAALADERGCYHVDDNAHGALSVHDGTLLGTRGHLGIASLRKLFPVPDGAVLYLGDDGVADRYEPTALAGVADGVDAGDCRFVLKSLAADLLDRNALVKESVESIAGRRGGAGDPGERYEAAKTRMSRLTARVVADVDPSGVRAARRTNYRVWRRLLRDRSDVEPLYETLPEGICPQVFPVRAERPRRLLAALERGGVEAHTWPRLPAVVRGGPAYGTARRLSREVVALPVHQHVEPSAIEEAGAALRR